MDDIKLTDLVEKYILQEIQDLFITKSNIAIGVSAADGEYITAACSDLNEFCELLIKKTPEGKRRCDMCDCVYAQKALQQKKALSYTCHAGLTDFTAPITVMDRLYGFIVGGQICTAPLSREHTDRLAKEYGIDAERLYAASKKIKVIDQSIIDQVVDDIDKISHIFSDIAYNKYTVLQANHEIEAAAKLKSDFLANMSHEIRTPMNAIIGMADIALRDNSPEEIISHLKQIKRSGKTLLNIINAILDFSKIESGNMDIIMNEYSPTLLVDDVAQIIQTRTKGKDVEFIIDMDSSLPGLLIGDETRIKQVITNLANNAIKFTQKGQVVLSVSSKKTDSISYDLTVRVTDTGIGIKKENLDKIFESFQQVDSKRNRNIEGTGLGLAISKNLVSLMNGTLTVESEYNVGSTFSFTLPQLELNHVEPAGLLSDDAIHVTVLVENRYIKAQLQKDFSKLSIPYNEAVFSTDLTAIPPFATHVFLERKDLSDKLRSYAGAHPQITFVVLLKFEELLDYNADNIIGIHKPVYLRNLIQLFNHEQVLECIDDEAPVVIDFTAPQAKILVVDDNEINLNVCTGLLKPLNIQVETALSGSKAIEMISETKYDLIFMDHMMPEMDGIETTHIIRRMHPEYDNVPIIALTANALEEFRGQFLVEGMNDFLAKPIDNQALFSMVKHWLPPAKIVPLETKIEIQQPAADVKFSDIDDLSVAEAISHVGNAAIYEDIVRDYFKAYPQKYNHILSSYQAHDFRDYTIQVHALKSASRQIGAMELGDLCEILEAAGYDQNNVLIDEKTPKMLQLYTSLYEKLTPYFGEKNKTEKKEQADNQTISALLDNIATAIEELDSSALDETLQSLTQYDFPAPMQEMVVSLTNAVDEFDFDTCESVLNQFRQLLAD